MRHLFAFYIVAISILVSFDSSACAQTLNEKLLAEDPAALVAQAKKDGDVVRGAILFHQGNINCAKCHRPTAEKDRLGPDLSRMDGEATDEFIVESILQPSKQIKKGFEPVIALTNDGRTVSGMIFEEDKDKILIRDTKDADKLITILRDDLDEMRAGKISNMPADLANELKNRKQFLDLLRYVIDIKDRGPEKESANVATTNRRSLEPALEGLVLIQQHNCVACHQWKNFEPTIAAKQAPRLNWSAKHLNPEYLSGFIADPHAVKPGTTMPSMFAGVDEEQRKRMSEQLVHFLTSKAKNEVQFSPTDAEAIQKGFELFNSVGCAACHAPRESSGKEIPVEESIPLGDLSQKYSVSALVEFLKDPLAVRPSGHMPSMKLTHREAINISNFVLQEFSGQNNKWTSNVELAKAGEQLFQKLNCTSCHTEFVEQVSSKPAVKSLLDSDIGKGCLAKDVPKENSGNGTPTPDFRFDSEQLVAIKAAIEKIKASSGAYQISSDQKALVTLRTFNCIACHDRGDFGGVHPDKNHHFQTTNMNLGDQGRIPPTLTGVGAKLKPKWMRDVLVNGRSVRPYMLTRMPQYGESNVGGVIKLFEESDKLEPTKFATFKDQKKTREAGWKMAGHKGLNCVACHTYQFKISDTMPAVDLTEMAERLEKDWFYQYMLDPQKFSPNTVMPSFWPAGKAIRPDLQGTPKDQVEALWQHLIDGRQARSPSSVVREPLEIVVTDEAKMLRRSYPEIGKRGIGVGYPGGINIAYDAEQMRVGSIWAGKFADPVGVWTGQGHGRVRAMGRPIHFPKGPELDSVKSPWVVDDGRPPQHQFRGYSLGKAQRPTFLYEFGSAKVEDLFIEEINKSKNEMGLRRQVTLLPEKDQPGLRFRIAASQAIQEENPKLFSLGKMKIEIISGHIGQLVGDEKNKSLEIAFDLKKGETHTIVLKYRLQE